MLKTLLFVVLSLFFFGSSKAQDSTSSQGIQTLMGSGLKVSGFGGFMTNFSTIDNSLVQFTGGGGGVLLNRSLFLGGFGLGSVNSISLSNTAQLVSMSQFGYGGLWLGYIFLPDHALHFGIDTKLGWGSISYSLFPSSSTDWTENVYVMHPGAFIEANITEWFKVNAGMGYRLVNGGSNSFLRNSRLSSPDLSLSFLFGWFN